MYIKYNPLINNIKYIKIYDGIDCAYLILLKITLKKERHGMGLFDRFSSGAIASKLAKINLALKLDLKTQKEQKLSGLKLQQVMDAHMAWKGKLQKVLDGTSAEKIDLQIASEDCHCFLGKWFYGEGEALYGRMPEYESARRAHAKFHVCAGEVLTQHMLGNDEEAERLLNTKYRSASNRNQLELVNLFTAAKR